MRFTSGLMYRPKNMSDSLARIELKDICDSE